MRDIKAILVISTTPDHRRRVGLNPAKVYWSNRWLARETATSEFWEERMKRGREGGREDILSFVQRYLIKSSSFDYQHFMINLKNPITSFKITFYTFSHLFLGKAAVTRVSCLLAIFRVMNQNPRKLEQKKVFLIGVDIVDWWWALVTDLLTRRRRHPDYVTRPREWQYCDNVGAETVSNGIIQIIMLRHGRERARDC